MSNNLSKSLIKLILIILVSIVLFAVGIPIISAIIGSGYEPIFFGVMMLLLIAGVVVDQIFRQKR